MRHFILETYLVRFIRYVIDWRDTRRIIRELNQLSDKQLKDIGISRGEIIHLAYTREQKNES
jgi:uncharacterized protein YjiS (DUF1127 family)